MSPFIAELSSRHSPGRGKLFYHLLLFINIILNRTPVNRGAAASLRLFTRDYQMCAQNVTETFQSVQSQVRWQVHAEGLISKLRRVNDNATTSIYSYFILGFKVTD